MTAFNKADRGATKENKNTATITHPAKLTAETGSDKEEENGKREIERRIKGCVQR